MRALRGPRGRTGVAGPQGPQGEQGPAGGGGGIGGALPRMSSVIPPWASEKPLYALGTASFGSAVSGLAYSVDTLLLYPFMVGANVTIDRLAMRAHNAVATSVFRFGIYDSDGTAGAPVTLLYGSAEQSGAVATTERIVSGVGLALTAGELYWYALLAGTASPNLSTYTAPAAMGAWIIGDSSGTLATGRRALSVAQAYGPLPATVPAGIAYAGSNSVPVLWGGA